MWNLIYLALWAATLPLMPYGLIRRKPDVFHGSLVAFCMLSINVLIMMTAPNPNMIKVIAVVAP